MTSDANQVPGMGPLDASTQLACVIGTPIKHSMSPAIHNAAFVELGLNWRYLAFEVRPQMLESALRGMVAMGFRGCSITVPLKVDAMQFMDRLDSLAERCGAINTVVIDNGELVGYNTDGLGFVDYLNRFTVASKKKCVILGAGGAARSIAFSLISIGCQVTIVNRSPERAQRLVDELNSARVESPNIAKSCGASNIAAEIDSCEIVINATSIGLMAHRTANNEAANNESSNDRPVNNKIANNEPARKGFTTDVANNEAANNEAANNEITATLLDDAVQYVKSDHVVVDIVYTPLETEFLAKSRKAGAVCVDGLGMLVHQAAYAFKLWTGEQAPIEVMTQAALSQLNKR